MKIDLPPRVKEWLSQPGARITPNQIQFIQAVRDFRKQGIGYGFMQQIIEWVWQEADPVGSWGPEYFQKRISELKERLKNVVPS